MTPPSLLSVSRWPLTISKLVSLSTLSALCQSHWHRFQLSFSYFKTSFSPCQTSTSPSKIFVSSLLDPHWLRQLHFSFVCSLNGPLPASLDSWQPFLRSLTTSTSPIVIPFFIPDWHLWVLCWSLTAPRQPSWTLTASVRPLCDSRLHLGRSFWPWRPLLRIRWPLICPVSVFLWPFKASCKTSADLF